MRLLIVADNGFSVDDNKYYYSRPNLVYSEQYRKYFEKLSFIARKDKHLDSDIAIPENENVFLVEKNNFVKIIKLMKEHNGEYDAVLARNGINGCIVAGTAKRLGKTYISYCGSDPISAQFSKGGLKNYIKGVVWHCLETRKMKKADYAHYCTEYLHEKYPCKCPFLVCSNVNIALEEQVLTRRIEHIGSHKSKFVIGLIGNVDSQLKGIDCAIKAMSLLDDRYELELVGRGNPTIWKDLIEKYGLTGRVRFLGFLSERDRINEWLDSIDCYIQPSLSEGLPRSMIEAMSRACPVVATAISDIPLLLQDEVLIKRRDYHGLAARVKKIHDDCGFAIEQATKNYDMSKKYSADIRNEKFNRFYGNIS